MLTPRSPKKSPKNGSLVSPLPSPTDGCSSSSEVHPIDLSRHKVHLKKLIGHGGTSFIYEATVDGWIVAAKVYHQFFPSRDIACDKQRERIQLILNALCSLPRHPNVLPLLGYTFINDNRLVVLCERVDCTLRDLIDERREDYYKAALQTPRFASFESLSSSAISQTTDDDDDSGDDDGDKEERKSFAAAVATAAAAPTTTATSMFGEQRSVPLHTLDAPPFTLQETLGMWKQIVKGVVFLHNLPEPCALRGGGRVIGVWHRDLKSENVMCSRLGADVDEILTEQESDSSANNLTSSGRIQCDLLCGGEGTRPDTNSGNGDAEKTSKGGAIHERYVLKVGDFDEMHTVYDVDDKRSPIRWQEGTLSDAENTADEASSGRVLRRSRTLAFSGRQQQPSAYESLSLNVGTPEFMAPEMANKKTAVYTEKVDIWSLGMILYELLTLELPYGRDSFTQFELPDTVQRGIRPTLPDGYLSRRTENKDSPWEGVTQLFFDCTEHDPEKRPSASDLMRRIDCILALVK